MSAESLARGETLASNLATLAAGSENPAALDASVKSATYATGLVYRSSTNIDAQDPLGGRVLQYMAIGAEKGVVFFEPLGRVHTTQALNPADPTAGTRDVDFGADAIGFAGANALGTAGSIGVSLSYLFSSIATADHPASGPATTHLDRGNGFRINIGLRYPQGPFMFGFLAENVPSFIWGSTYRREQLPVKTRAGVTYRILSGILVSMDAERRFYHEGGSPENWYYIGNESHISQIVTLRIGAYGQHPDQSQDQHLTAGITLTSRRGYALSYAYDKTNIDDESENRSMVSLTMPFEADKPSQ